MKPSSSRWRRSCSLVCILLALLMLGAGETLLTASLRGIGLLLYWLVCLFLTLAGAGAALLEVLHIGARGRAEQRALLETTLREAEREKPELRKPR